MNTKELHNEKATWGLQKTTYSFGQSLQVTPHKTVAVQTFTYHLKNFLVRRIGIEGHCGRSKR